MMRGSILIWENHEGSSNKFYTMISNGTDIVCNYGVDTGEGWNKQTIKSVDQWHKAVEDRQKHGYTRVGTGTIDYDWYVKVMDKIEALHAVIGDNAMVSLLRHNVAKNGNLIKEDMAIANKLWMEYNDAH